MSCYTYVSIKKEGVGYIPLFSLCSFANISRCFEDEVPYEKMTKLTDEMIADAKDRVKEDIDTYLAGIRRNEREIDFLKGDNSPLDEKMERVFDCNNTIEDYQVAIKDCEHTIAQLDMLAWMLEEGRWEATELYIGKESGFNPDGEDEDDENDGAEYLRNAYKYADRD